MSSKIVAEQIYPEVVISGIEGVRETHGIYPGELPTSGVLPIAKQEGKQGIRESHRVPCGLNSIVFAILVALLTTIIVGGAVGGGIGGSLAHEKSENKALRAATSSLAQLQMSTSPLSSTAPTPTTGITNYTVVLPQDISSLALDCPAIDGQSYATIRSQSYTIHCGVSLNAYDVASIIAYTIDDCIEACSSVNYFLGNSTYCVAALFGTDLATDAAGQHANCWLKNRVEVSSQNSPSAGGVAAAYLDNNSGSQT